MVDVIVGGIRVFPLKVVVFKLVLTESTGADCAGGGGCGVSSVECTMQVTAFDNSVIV